MKFRRCLILAIPILIQGCTSTSYKPNDINAIRCNLFSTTQEYIFSPKGKLFYLDSNKNIKPLKKIVISESGLNKHIKVFTSKRVGNWLIIRIKTSFENIKDQPIHETVDRINIKKRLLISVHKHGTNDFKSKGNCKFIPFKSVREVSKWS
tara:strand:- start:48 stop:500 length:453 start_codon:yes stop_codon:yes gene_type:complete